MQIHSKKRPSVGDASSQGPFFGSPRHSRGRRGPDTRVTDRRRELVRRAYADERLVPLAIADKLDLKVRTVARYLRELEETGAIEPIPRWLTLTPPPRESTHDAAEDAKK